MTDAPTDATSMLAATDPLTAGPSAAPPVPTPAPGTCPIPPRPPARRLRVFAFDPLASTSLDMIGINETMLEVRWEDDLLPGPVGEYLEVIDVDPAAGCCYAPVDLNHPFVLSESGLRPSEASPQFHQQMVYAVAMKTIGHFEHALGRTALWAPRETGVGPARAFEYVSRLRIYPHGIREANAYYSPAKKALLLGYFPAGSASLRNLPGGYVFCCLSHDVVAHETSHALLDGLHRRWREPTNRDVLAFHEAFADIVAIFQHFTMPDALRDRVARCGGDLGREGVLGGLAQQFGDAIGLYGPLRSAIVPAGDGGPEAARQLAESYRQAQEPHDLGAVLVGAVFDAFLTITRRRSDDLVRLATGGTGVLSPGAIPHELVNRLADEAGKAAEQVLNICIRALDYCPPVDVTFGDFLRALVTADSDLVEDDRRGYRVAFVEAFRRRGIYPSGVRSLSSESLAWQSPPIDLSLEPIVRRMSLAWNLRSGRRQAFDASRANAAALKTWLDGSAFSDEGAKVLGFFRSSSRSITVDGTEGALSRFEVHSVRPVRRVGPDGQQRVDLVIEITQKWTPLDSQEGYRGGCTLLVDPDTGRVRYCIRKRVASEERVAAQREHAAAEALLSPRAAYFSNWANAPEPFAMLHGRRLGEGR